MSAQIAETTPSVKNDSGSKETRLFLLWCYGRKKKDRSTICFFNNGLFTTPETAKKYVGELIEKAEKSEYVVSSDDIHITEAEQHGFFVLPSGV